MLQYCSGNASESTCLIFSLITDVVQLGVAFIQSIILMFILQDALHSDGATNGSYIGLRRGKIHLGLNNTTRSFSRPLARALINLITVALVPST